MDTTPSTSFTSNDSSDTYKHFVQRITNYFITLNDRDHWASAGLLFVQLGQLGQSRISSSSYDYDDATWRLDVIRRMCDEGILVEGKQVVGGAGNVEVSVWMLHPGYARSFGLAAPTQPTRSVSQNSCSTRITGKKRPRSRSPNDQSGRPPPSFGDGRPRAISISSSDSEGGSPEPIPNPSPSGASPRRIASSHCIPRKSTGPGPLMEKQPRVSPEQNNRVVNDGLPSIYPNNAELEQRITRCEEFSGASIDNLVQLRQEMMQEIHSIKMDKMENSVQNNRLWQDVNHLKRTSTEHFRKISQLTNENVSLNNLVFALRAKLDEQSIGIDAEMRDFRARMERQIHTWYTHTNEGVTGLYAKMSMLEQQINGLNDRFITVEKEVKRKDQDWIRTVTTAGTTNTSTKLDIVGHDMQRDHRQIENLGNLDVNQLSDRKQVQETETEMDHVLIKMSDGAAMIEKTREKPMKKKDQEQRRVELMEPKITSLMASTDSILERLQKLEQNVGANNEKAHSKSDDPSTGQIQQLSQRISTLEKEREIQSLETDNLDVTLKTVAQLLEEVEARVVSIEDNAEIVVQDDLNKIIEGPEGVKGRLEVLEQRLAQDSKLGRKTDGFMCKSCVDNLERIKKLEESITVDKMVIEKTLGDAVEKRAERIRRLEEWKGQTIKQMDERLGDISNTAIQGADEGKMEAIEKLTKRVDKIEELVAQNKITSNGVDEDVSEPLGIITTRPSKLENSNRSVSDKEWGDQDDEKLTAAINGFTKLKKRVKILEENEMVRQQKLVGVGEEKLDGMMVESTASRIQKIEESEELIHSRLSGLDDASLIFTADTEKLSQRVKILEEDRIADEKRINVIDEQMETVLSEVKDGYDMLKRSVRTFTSSFERRIGEVDERLGGVVEDVGKVRRKIRGLANSGN